MEKGRVMSTERRYRGKQWWQRALWGGGGFEWQASQGDTHNNQYHLDKAHAALLAPVDRRHRTQHAACMAQQTHGDCARAGVVIGRRRR